VLNEPDGARTWLPSNDHPSDKATWTFELAVPTGFAAAANGELVTRTRGDDGELWLWAESQPMSTYLVQVVVGNYEVVVTDPIESVSGKQIAMTHVVPVGERTTFQQAVDSITPQMAFFEERFGPYPLDRYGLAFVNDLSGVAMETQGRSMFGADEFSSGELGLAQQLLLSHELAHQWFGNAVSPAGWDDIWLNESLTTYAQWLWLDEIGLQPLEAYAGEMLARRQSDGESTGNPSVAEMFGFLRYDGGAPVVHALRRTMGDEAFFGLMATWIADNTGTSQSTEAFIALAEAVLGRDLTDFFDDWLFSGDLPDAYPE
jgi:aminopeptidase N